MHLFFATFLATILSLQSATFSYAPGMPAAVVRALMGGHETHVLFTGDMMFDRAVRLKTDVEGGDFLFSCIDDTFANADLVVGNLEGPITPNDSVSIGSAVGSPKNFVFTFPPVTAIVLARNHVQVVNLGNNHIMNFSREGLVQTKKWLDQAGDAYFGDPDSLEADKVARPTINGVPFSFVNWSDWTSDKTDHTVAQVRAEAESGRVVVVYTHWGEEYVPPTKQMRQLAHSFIDAGATIVIGSHPHIVQEHEMYNGKNIYYSLGNFIFDQYWNDDVRHGLLLRVTFNSTGVQSVREIPIELEHDRRTCLLQ